MERYKTSGHKKRLIMPLGIALIVAVAICTIAMIRSAQADNRILAIEYPMSNQHIEWNGAGYNGIWGK